MLQVTVHGQLSPSPTLRAREPHPTARHGLSPDSATHHKKVIVKTEKNTCQKQALKHDVDINFKVMNANLLKDVCN